MSDSKVDNKLKLLSSSLGFENNTNQMELKTTDDKNIKELHIKDGEFNPKEPWFVSDSEDENVAYAVLPSEYFNQLLNVMKDIQRENFNLKLEKSILRHMPTDFEDVWIVAMDRIEKLIDKENPSKPITIDIDRLVDDIKNQHPNLFINMKNFFPPMLR